MHLKKVRFKSKNTKILGVFPPSLPPSLRAGDLTSLKRATFSGLNLFLGRAETPLGARLDLRRL